MLVGVCKRTRHWFGAADREYVTSLQKEAVEPTIPN